MDLPTVVGQQTLYYIEVSLSFTYFLSLPLLKSYRKLLSWQKCLQTYLTKKRTGRAINCPSCFHINILFLKQTLRTNPKTRP